MPTTLKIVLKKKLNTELAYVRTRVEDFGGHIERSLIGEFSHKIAEKACSGDREQSVISRKRKLPKVSEPRKESANVYYDEEFVMEKSEAVSCVTPAFKRNRTGELECQNVKGLKMDVTEIRQCSNVLMTLMNHQNGWVFSQPVDPVKLNIPDYFSIIKKPMDLGTIKNKLKRKLYSSTHEFAADVRLTFSNAMSYNPPDNPVHGMAKNLNNIFNARWVSLEFKWRKECPNSLLQSPRKPANKTSKQILQSVPSCNSSSLTSKSFTVADKLKLQNSLGKFSRENFPPRLLKFLQKTRLLEQSGERINVDVDSLDESTLWELHQIVRNCEDAGSLKPGGQMKNSQGLMAEYEKGEIRVTCSAKDCTVPSACMDSNHPCVSTDCPCSRHSKFTQASISDIDSEGSCRQNPANHSVVSGLDVDNISRTLRKNDIADTAGRMGNAVVDVDNALDISSPSSQPTASPLKEIGFTYEEQLSPTRALRAAKLKSRFADTIYKAQQKTLLDHGDKSDPARMQHEREKLEKQRHQEKARIEAEIKAAEAAVRMKAEAELRMRRERAEAELKKQRERAEAEHKMQREREREAARLALQKMEKTVDIDENSQFFKDVENLGYSHPVHLDLENFMDAQQCALANPLAQLGLFIKDDDLDEDFDKWISSTGDDDDAEEGEIGLL